MQVRAIARALRERGDRRTRRAVNAAAYACAVPHVQTCAEGAVHLHEGPT